MDNVDVVVDDGIVVPGVAVAGVTIVAPVTATDDGWDVVDVVVVDDPVVNAVDVVDDVDDVTGATGTATGSSVNTSGLPVPADVDPEETGSVVDVAVVTVGRPVDDEVVAATVGTVNGVLN